MTDKELPTKIHISVGHKECFAKVDLKAYAHDECLLGPSATCICGTKTTYWHSWVLDPAKVKKRRADDVERKKKDLLDAEAALKEVEDP